MGKTAPGNQELAPGYPPENSDEGSNKGLT